MFMLLRRTLSAFVIAIMLVAIGGCGGDQGSSGNLSLQGVVESNGVGLRGYNVALYASFVSPTQHTAVLGRDVTNSSGNFDIHYSMPSGQQAVLFVLASRGSAMLASAIGNGPVAGPVDVNERTTIATGFSFAQFVNGAGITGNTYGMLNATHMAANMANPQTGAIAEVLGRSPNGSETETLATFNSLADMVAYCVETETGCNDLFDEATVPGGSSPANVLQAVANIAKYPWSNVTALFSLSMDNPVYAPALAGAPNAWTLFLKFTGAFSSKQTAQNLLNGPGAFAIDSKGYIWVNDNYTPAKPLASACAGERLLKFYPWGENFPGSPYFGGGLSGAGFGISIAPDNRIWVGNFGFSGKGCPVTPSADSVSVFQPDGRPIPSSPYTAGPISWPQATVADPAGNIWIADCEADTVTIYPQGNPNKAIDVPFPHATPTPSTGYPVAKPFGIAIDQKGDAWVTGGLNSTLAVYGPKGNLVQTFDSKAGSGRTQLSRPLGVASDSHGNIWVANSDWLDPPCPSGLPKPGAGTNPSIALFLNGSSRHPDHDSPFIGGGLTLPWGIAVDGNNTVWVANFGFPFDVKVWPAPNRVSHFCGVDTWKCPPTKQRVGEAISPDKTGYTSNALDRVTGIAIDPSGNVWLVNNWKKAPLLNNPGQNSIVALVGAAAPVKTPLIGTPKSFATNTTN